MARITLPLALVSEHLPDHSARVLLNGCVVAHCAAGTLAEAEDAAVKVLAGLLGEALLLSEARVPPADRRWSVPRAPSQPAIVTVGATGEHPVL